MPCTAGLTKIPNVELVTDNERFTVHIVAVPSSDDELRMAAVAYSFTKKVNCTAGGYHGLDMHLTTGVMLVGSYKFREFFQDIAATFNRKVLAPLR